MPSEHQESFLFDGSVGAGANIPDPLTDFFMEVGKAWDVPLGEQVRVRLRDSALPELNGKLRLARAPDLPLDPRLPLALLMNGIEFTHRDIAAWVLA